jgi:hypothetical protein
MGPWSHGTTCLLRCALIPSDPPAGFPGASAADWLVQARITRHCRTPLERDLSKLIRPCSA